MLQRYIGNKNILIDSVLEAIGLVASQGQLVCDAFSGSLAVSIALKKKGYRVAANDINLLSWIYGIAYLKNSDLPPFNSKLLERRVVSRGARLTKSGCRESWEGLLERLIAKRDRSIPRSAWRNDFFEHYCEEGSQSAFVSSRGRTGRRRFFTAVNAQTIDRALSRIRWWWRSGLIDESVRCLLTALLLDAIEKVSNTQGTYHDFPREFFDSRALRPLRLTLPDLCLMQGRTDHLIGRAEDSLDFIRGVPSHSVLYLDPPYNFRQYTSYYFLPNIVARYPEIESLDDYFANIDFVRGQNMEDDFTSTFCKSAQFIPSLEKIISRANCEYVVMSYFDGKNHWSDFKTRSDNYGRRQLESFFRSDLFIPGSMTCKPVKRMNYQSYGGYSAAGVKEFLFTAKKCASGYANLDELRSGGKNKPITISV